MSDQPKPSPEDEALALLYETPLVHQGTDERQVRGAVSIVARRLVQVRAEEREKQQEYRRLAVETVTELREQFIQAKAAIREVLARKSWAIPITSEIEARLRAIVGEEK